jgi:rhodanese-related sulfurtransferase
MAESDVVDRIPEIDPATAHASLDDFRIVDVRESFEVEGPLGTVMGAENLPLGEVEKLESLASERLLLVCRSGKRSAMACAILRQRGIPDVTNLEGGMIAWNRAALPIVRRRPETLASLLLTLNAWLSQVSGSSRDEARTRLEVWLGEAGASLSAPTHVALEHLLERMEDTLIESGKPPDLDLTIEAFRRDLAAL